LIFQTWKIVQGEGDPSLVLGMTLFLGLGLGKEVAIREQNINLRIFLRIATSFPPCPLKKLSSRALARDPRGSAGNCHIDLYSKMYWHSH